MVRRAALYQAVENFVNCLRRGEAKESGDAWEKVNELRKQYPAEFTGGVASAFDRVMERVATLSKVPAGQRKPGDVQALKHDIAVLKAKLATWRKEAGAGQRKEDIKGGLYTGNEIDLLDENDYEYLQRRYNP